MARFSILANQPLDAGEADAIHLGQLPFRCPGAEGLEQCFDVLSGKPV